MVSFICCVFSNLLYGQVGDSIDGDFLHLINDAEHTFPPLLTTRDRELVSVLESRAEPGDRTQDLWIYT